VQRPLHGLSQAIYHIIAQIVEAEFVIGAIGDIAGIGFTTWNLAEMLQATVILALVFIFRIIDESAVMDDDAGREPQGMEDRSHPAGADTRQIVIDRHQVGALALQGIEV